MDFKNLLKSKTFVMTLGVTAIVLAALVVFAGGVEIGRRSAFFSCKWAQNYERNFGMPRGGFMMRRGNVGANPQGAFGEIISINLPTLVVASSQESEKTVVVTDDTTVQRDNARATASDLRIGDRVIVIGRPDDQGQVEAKLIRVLDSATGSRP